MATMRSKIYLDDRTYVEINESDSKEEAQKQMSKIAAELKEEEKLSESLVLKQEQIKEHVKKAMTLQDQFNNQVIKRTQLTHELWKSIELCSSLKGESFIKQLLIVQEKNEQVIQAVKAENIIIAQGRKALGEFDNLVDLMKAELNEAISKQTSYYKRLYHDRYMPWCDDARKRFSAVHAMFEEVFVMKANTDKLGINCEALIEKLEEQEEQEKLSATPSKEKKDSPSSSKEHTPPSPIEDLSLARTSSDSSSSDELKERQPKSSSTAHLQAEMKKSKPSVLEKKSSASLPRDGAGDDQQVVEKAAVVKKPVSAFNSSQSPLSALSIHKNGRTPNNSSSQQDQASEAQKKKCIIM